MAKPELDRREGGVAKSCTHLSEPMSSKLFGLFVCNAPQPGVEETIRCIIGPRLCRIEICGAHGAERQCASADIEAFAGSHFTQFASKDVVGRISPRIFNIEIPFVGADGETVEESVVHVLGRLCRPRRGFPDLYAAGTRLRRAAMPDDR